jgi:molybdate transport system substrate-binding protein
MSQRYQITAPLPRIALMIAAGFVVATSAAADSVTVFAASSMHDALGVVAKHYEAETQADVTLVFAASSTVARQAAQGAPADVVVLADVAWADWLIENSDVGDMVPVAGNDLVLIGRNDATVEDGIIAALGEGMLAMAQIDAVPAGRYGKAALDHLGLWDALSPRIIQAANVRAALRFVQIGEAPLAIGYSSDAVAFADLTVVYEFAPDAHAPIVYYGGRFTLRGADFVTFLQGEQGQEILASWGFSPVGAP